MRASQLFFKFPVRLYDTLESRELQKTEELTSQIQREVRDYVVAWKRLRIQEIEEWCSGFPIGLTLDEVKNRGLELTIVSTMDANYTCDWTMEQFEKEYDKHCKKLEKWGEKFPREEKEKDPIIFTTEFENQHTDNEQDAED